MFGLRFKSPYRRYEYVRFSKKDQVMCTVSESQYSPVLDITSFGLIGWFLYSMLSCGFKFEYSFNVGMIFFIVFMFVRLLMIIEKEENSEEGD